MLVTLQFKCKDWFGTNSIIRIIYSSPNPTLLYQLEP